MLRVARLVVLGLLICFCQAWPQTAPESKVSDLADCKATLSSFQAWYDKEKPKNDALLAENTKLKEGNEELEDEARDNQNGRAFIFGLGVGIVIVAGFSAYYGTKRLRKVFPLTKTRKQLAILLLAATWITVAAVVGMADATLIHHPINLLSAVFVYSLPALAFGGVGAWWFGRTKPEILW
jgi:cell division protein FtsB